ncbi:T9SS type A sorting domain-containing protein [Reichenbachiella carrageenanivorans]|uniref:T9SS type A sorting domain-containing protein n=1 Tax=Reichenbachiella carrageenanivorans TaxID=2979869 RepID=A0ABY6D3C4_9BACT|nr:T9SS type A sorting domain-containing protein [Reichenbachiella carrageenanivorans]UXX80661.1 T9SS type A sorting domain-containing protein [Reichenbachiella carrageenanivorans]
MKNLICTLALSIASLSAYAQPCSSCNQGSATKTWEGDVSANWNDAANWSGNTLPTTQSVTIDGGSIVTYHPVISTNSTFSPADVFIQNGATLTIQADITITDDFFIRNGATLFIEGGSSTTGDDINLCKGGTINMSGGNVDNTNSSGLMRVCETQPAAATGTPQIIVTGGTFSSNGSEAESGDVEDYITVSSGGTYTEAGSSLPVDMISFTGVLHKKLISLRWVTGSEQNNSHFEIQRSEDQDYFETIGKVEGTGTTSNRQTYQFLDDSNQGEYYQLKQIDYDGKAKIYGPIRVSSEPLRNRSIHILKTGEGMLDISVTHAPKQCLMYNLTGHVVFDTPVSNHFTIDSRDFPKGIYVIKMHWDTDVITQKVFID